MSYTTLSKDQANLDSGLLRLEDSYTPLPKDPVFETDFWRPVESIADGVAKEASRISAMFCSADPPIPIEKVSPFIMDLFYHARSIFGERARQTGSESAAKAAENLSTVLVGLNTRWRAAG